MLVENSWILLVSKCSLNVAIHSVLQMWISSRHIFKKIFQWNNVACKCKVYECIPHCVANYTNIGILPCSNTSPDCTDWESWFNISLGLFQVRNLPQAVYKMIYIPFRPDFTWLTFPRLFSLLLPLFLLPSGCYLPLSLAIRCSLIQNHTVILTTPWGL